MTEINQNFTMYAGDTKVLSIPVIDSGGVAKTLTGGTATFHLHDPGGALKLTRTITTFSTATICEVSMAPADTSGLAAGDYTYGVRFTDSTGVVGTITTGTIHILDSVI